MKTYELRVDLPKDGECERCLTRLEESLALIRGVQHVEAHPELRELTIAYDPELTPISRLEEVARDLGAGIASRFAHETLTVTDLDCADCAAKLEAAVGRMPGVVHASVNFTAGTLRIEYLPDRVSRPEVVARIQLLGYGVAEPVAATEEATSEFRVTGMDCADCAATIERNVAALAGVAEARVNFAAATLTVRHAATTDFQQIVRVIEASGYGAAPVRARQVVRERSFWVRNRRAILTSGSGLVLAAGLALQMLGVPSLIAGITFSRLCFALAMLLGGYHVARRGLYGLVTSRTFDMNVLMSVAALGAVAIGEWSEGATVVFLFALGNTLEGYTMDRARGAIRALMELAPSEALVRRGSAEIKVPVEEVGVGEVVVVRPGEKVPVDGRVIGGTSAVNQASITGESVPVGKAAGDEVYAGSINERGYLEVESSRPASENTISRIVNLVEEAQAQRAPSQRFVDRFAHYYTPAVIAAAVGIAVVPWFVFGQPFADWFYRALVLLVIACPCALVISTPVSIVSAIARAARLGVLIKGGAYLEEAGDLRVVAFDKTGTLTAGHPEVTDVVPLSDLPPEEVLHLAAAVEGRSEHPLAAAVLRRTDSDARDGKLGEASGHAHEVAEFEAVTGKGVRASVDGKIFYVGSLRLFEELGLPLGGAPATVHQLQAEGKTVLLVGTREAPVGLVAVADQLRPGARAAVKSLRAAGIDRIVLLTGDHEETARAIARRVGADEYRAGLLPGDKVAAVKELRARYGKVAMVGDGVNDAPALSAANVGIAMGAAGADVALEAADVALMSDDLQKVAVAIGLSRAALATVRLNIAFSLAIKGLFLAATMLGLVTLWLAIAADMGASLLVTLNGMRLLGYQRRGGAAAVVHDQAHGPPAHAGAP